MVTILRETDMKSCTKPVGAAILSLLMLGSMIACRSSIEPSAPASPEVQIEQPLTPVTEEPEISEPGKSLESVTPHIEEPSAAVNEQDTVSEKSRVKEPEMNAAKIIAAQAPIPQVDIPTTSPTAPSAQPSAPQNTQTIPATAEEPTRTTAETAAGEDRRSDIPAIEDHRSDTPVTADYPNKIEHDTTEPIIIHVTNIIVTANRQKYCVGEQGRFSVQIIPEDASDKTISIIISGAASELSGEKTFLCTAEGQATITVIAANGVSGSVTVSVIDLTGFASEVIRLINIERQNNSLQPLTQTSELTQTALVRAWESIILFAHDRPDGQSCFTAFNENNVSYTRAAENLGKGQKRPAEVVQDWMNSPGHRAVILNEDYARTGVGVVMDNNGILYWAQSFTD